MVQLRERTAKSLQKTQLFLGDSLSKDSNEDALQQLFLMMQQVAEAHSQAVHDISEWKRKDSKTRLPKYSKRASRINTTDGSELLASQFSLHAGGRDRAGDLRGGCVGQSEMLRQMKEQMIKMRQNKETGDIADELLLEDDEESDDLL